MKKDKDSQELGLFNEVETESNIVCQKCDAQNTIQGDAAEAACFFYRKGWRVTEKLTYCPKCAKKYLKP